MSLGLTGLLHAIGGRSVGLVTGPTGWLGPAGHLLDRLHERGLLRALFAPEHGVWGDLQAGEHVPGGIDERTGMPVFSLYGERHAPTPDQLAQFDVLVGCLQDAGGRPYTFSTTLAACLEVCVAAGRPMILLDRPTPLGGEIVQGNVAGGYFFPTPLPMRPGLTIGEQLQLLAARRGWAADLTVVPLVAAPRAKWYDELPVPWLAPSPNLPTLTSALVFGATVVLEGTAASEGRGTTRPFELLGAPWCDGTALAAELNALELPGLLCREASFSPTFSKHQGAVCHGIQLHITDRLAFDPPRVGLHVLAALRRRWPEELGLSPAGLDVRYHTSAVREALEAGAAVDDIAAGWQTEAAAFREEVADRGIVPEWSAAG